MTAIDQLLLGGFLSALVLGAAAQASRFCPQGGLREAMRERRPQRLAAYFAAAGVALLAVAALQLVLQQPLVPSRPPYLSANLPWGRYLLGGLLFGAGMVLARGCPLRTAVRSAQGSGSAAVLLIAMGIAAFAMSRTALFDRGIAPWLVPLSFDLHRWGWPSQGLDALLGFGGPSGRVITGAVLGVTVLGLAARRLAWQGHRTLWLGAALIGLMVAAGYALTAGPIGMAAADEASFMGEPPDGLGVQSFSYAGPLGDAANFLRHPMRQTWTLGVAMLLGTWLGALLSALARGEFRLQGPAAPRAMAVPLAGALMTGAGAVIGLGCTVGHGLSGVAVLSLGSAMALASIFAGASLVVWLESLMSRRSGAVARG